MPRLETAVYLELRRRHGRIREGTISYYTTGAGHEVDVVVGDAEQDEVVSIIQVSTDMADPATRHRELRALGESMQELGLATATLVTLTESGTEQIPEGTVHVEPAWRWMTHPDRDAR